MIKIMIVDDMPIFLEYLKGCVNWQEYGFEICAEATNGKEALEKMEEYYPDVVLTDIMMPYIDGIELAEQIVKRYPETAIIVITGNNEFDYARKAVKIGVCDYIVKPFEKEELILSLLKLKDNVNRALENTNMRQEAYQMKKEELLRQIILGNHIDESVWKKHAEKEVGVKFSSDFYLLCTMRLHTETASELENILNWERILINLLKDMIHLNGNYEIFKNYEGDIVIIMSFETEEDQKAYKAYEFVDLLKIVKSQLGIEGTVCVSDYCNKFDELKKSYHKTLDVLVNNKTDQVVKLFEKKYANMHVESTVYSPQYIEEINQALLRKDKVKLDKLWEKEWESAYRNGSESACMQLISTLLGILLSDIINSGRNIESVFGEKFSPYKKLYGISEIENKQKTLLNYYHMWLESEERRTPSRAEIVAEHARTYIQEHYTEGDLNIAHMSKDLYVNQTYLRKMFKEEMGMTISEYITKYRMHVAKQLILSSDYSLSQIAEKIGYNDVSYFSKCFKKYYNVSPKNMTKEVYQSYD